MNDFKAVVTNSILPRQLKDYFTDNKKVNEALDINIIKDIEELYAFYKFHYIFDTTEFNAYVITSLKSCKKLDILIDYIKKAIENNLEFEPKDKEHLHTNHHRFNVDSSTVDKVFAEVFNDFSKIADKFYKQNLNNVNLIQTYKNLGKMELINDLTNDKDYKDLLSMGKDILNHYIKCDG